MAAYQAGHAAALESGAVAELVKAARAALGALAQHPTRMYAVEHSELDAALAPFHDPPTSHPPRSAMGAADLAVTE